MIGSRAAWASASKAGSSRASESCPWRLSSTANRSGKASLSCARSFSAAGFCPSSNRREIGPSVPPVRRKSPSACAASWSSSTAGLPEASSRKKPSDDRRCRLSSPLGVSASATSGSGCRRCASGLSASVLARESPNWQPMIGCTPFFAQASANSKAPNRLPVSVSASAGMPSATASAASFSTLIAPSESE